MNCTAVHVEERAGQAFGCMAAWHKGYGVQVCVEWERGGLTVATGIWPYGARGTPQKRMCTIKQREWSTASDKPIHHHPFKVSQVHKAHAREIRKAQAHVYLELDLRERTLVDAPDAGGRPVCGVGGGGGGGGVGGVVRASSDLGHGAMDDGAAHAQEHLEPARDPRGRRHATVEALLVRSQFGQRYDPKQLVRT